MSTPQHPARPYARGLTKQEREISPTLAGWRLRLHRFLQWATPNAVPFNDMLISTDLPVEKRLSDFSRRNAPLPDRINRWQGKMSPTDDYHLRRLQKSDAYEIASPERALLVARWLLSPTTHPTVTRTGMVVYAVEQLVALAAEVTRLRWQRRVLRARITTMQRRRAAANRSKTPVLEVGLRLGDPRTAQLQALINDIRDNPWTDGAEMTPFEAPGLQVTPIKEVP